MWCPPLRRRCILATPHTPTPPIYLLDGVRVPGDDQRMQRGPKVDVGQRRQRARHDTLRLRPHARHPHRQRLRPVRALPPPLLNLQQLGHRGGHAHEARRLIHLLAASQALQRGLFDLRQGPPAASLSERALLQRSRSQPCNLLTAHRIALVARARPAGRRSAARVQGVGRA